MVNIQLFQTLRGALLAKADVRNEAGGVAYALSPQHQLAQLAATGCLNQTFYADAQTQLSQVLELAMQVPTDFLAKTAIYARQAGHMKDMPAVLAAVLAVRDVGVLARVFDQVIDNGKMLRNFVQVMRSGAVGRKSLGTRPKKLVQQWLLTASESQLLHAAVGTQPSLADVVKMVHPKPTEAWRDAWLAWLIGRPFDAAALPPITAAFERYKQDRSAPLPEVPFQMLTALDLDTAAWAQIAQRGSWQMVRQNLNTFARHGVFTVPGMTEQVAAKLRNPEAVAKARVLPYQLLAAFTAAGGDVPADVKLALQDAMELATHNVPSVAGHVVVCPDVSGSMGSSVTGYRKGATSAVRCIDVAGLMAASVLRQNPNARVLPFEIKVVNVALNPRDSVMTNAQKLAAIGGGGTACSAPLIQLNKDKLPVDLVILVSDNMSWWDRAQGEASQLMQAWRVLKARNPNAKLVCLDIQPYTSTQVPDEADVLNVGGFSDAVFGLIANFANAKDSTGQHWVDVINAQALPGAH